MARQRLREGIATGIQTILGQLAQFFRLGASGAIQPGEEAQPGRERLQRPEDIVATLAARHELPTPETGTRRSYSYVAVWTDAATGQRLGATRIQIEASPDVPRSTIDSRARREAGLQLPRYVSSEIISDRRVRMSLRKVGTVDLPPQP